MSITGVTPSRAHQQEEITITGTGFGTTEDAVTIGGQSAEVVSWDGSSIVVLVPEYDFSGPQTIVVTVGGTDYSYTGFSVIVGDVIQFVDATSGALLLDINNGGEPGATIEYWKQTGTKFPPPDPELNFEDPDLEDGGVLISDRMPRREITLVLLVTAESKSKLDEAFRSLFAQVLKRENCIKYQPEGAAGPLYYTTYKYKSFDPSEYFRWSARRAHLAGEVTIVIECEPWAEGDWIQGTFMENVVPEGSFETVSGSGTSAVFGGWAKSVSGAGSSVGLNTTHYWDGSSAVEFITDAVADAYGELELTDYKTVDPLKAYNCQLMGWKVSGTPRFFIDILCYDSAENLKGTISCLSAVSPAAAAFEDMVELSGSPVIYPYDSGLTPCWPTADTVKVKAVLKAQADHDTPAAQDIIVDCFLLSETDYAIGNKCLAAVGFNVPPGVIPGDAPTPMDLYFSGAWTPGEWQQQSSGIYTPLYWVSMVDATHGWAVGANGAIRFFNGSAWGAQTSGVAVSLYGVSAFDANTIWAVGADGTILASADGGTTWSQQTFPAFSNLLSVGDMESWTSATSMTYWDKTLDGDAVLERTTDKQSGTYAARFALDASGPGIYSGEGYIILKAAQYVPINPLKSYTVEGYVKGYAPPLPWFLSIRCYDAGKVFLGNAKTASGTVTTSYALKSLTATPSDYPAGTAYLSIKCKGLEKDDEYTGLVVLWVEFDTVSLKQSSLPALYGVHAIAANNIIAVGEWGTIITSADGTTWTLKTSGTDNNLRAISAVDATHIWAVGDAGTILFSADGNTWTAQTSGTAKNLYSVFALDASNVWAMGEDGTILYYNGSVWTSLSSPTSEDIRSVAVYTNGGVKYGFASGNKGTLLKWTSTAGGWATVGSGTAENLYGIDCTDQTHIWAVGGAGVIVFGILGVRKLAVTDLMLGQRDEYSDDFDPVREAVAGTGVTVATLGQRNRSEYAVFEAAATQKFLFNAEAHRGRYLISVGACVSGGTVDQVKLDFSLETAGGQAITPEARTETVDLSVASGGSTALQYWREVCMLQTVRFISREFPSHFIAAYANAANVNQVILLTAGALGADYLWVDCISLIPTDRAFVGIKEFGATGTAPQYAHLILDSHSHFVLAATDISGSGLDSAMIYDGTKWENAPAFEADPAGMNLTMVAANKTGSGNTQDYQLTPRLNIYWRCRPKYLLMETSCL